MKPADMTDVYAKLLGITDGIAEKRARNRANFPNAAAFMDQFARFNPRLIYASEGGKTIGTPT